MKHPESKKKKINKKKGGGKTGQTDRSRDPDLRSRQQEGCTSFGAVPS